MIKNQEFVGKFFCKKFEQNLGKKYKNKKHTIDFI